MTHTCPFCHVEFEPDRQQAKRIQQERVVSCGKKKCANMARSVAAKKAHHSRGRRPNERLGLVTYTGMRCPWESGDVRGIDRLGMMF